MNWVDTPLLVYSGIEGHPAKPLIVQALSRDEWGSTVLALFEVYSVLIRDYLRTPQEASLYAEDLFNGPINWHGLDVVQADSILQVRRRYSISDPDAAVLLLCREDRGTLYTLDQRLARAAQSEGLATTRLLDDALVRQVQDWEGRTLRVRGTPRILGSVHRWLRAEAPVIGDKFVEATGRLSRPPTP